jgi:hypothetical protein
MHLHKCDHIPFHGFLHFAINSQKQLDSVDIMARTVGLKINRAETEFMVVGHWASSIELRVSTATLNLFKDFQNLGSLLLNCLKDFEIKKLLAWKASILVVKIWKSSSISNAVKVKLFRDNIQSKQPYQQWCRLFLKYLIC